MAVDTTYAPVEEAGNGVKTAFDFAFKIFAKTDLVVRKKSATGVYGAPLTVDVHYTVTFDSIAENGTVTYADAPVNGGASNIQRASARSQATVYPREGVLPAKTTENAVDKLTLLAQEIYYWVSKRVPAYAAQPSNPPGIIITNPPVNAKAAMWVSNGDGTFNLSSSTDDINGITTAAAASAAAAASSAAAASGSAAASAASAVAAAASAAAAATFALAYSSGLKSARPAAPVTGMIYEATDEGNQLYIWTTGAAAWRPLL